MLLKNFASESIPTISHIKILKFKIQLKMAAHHSYSPDPLKELSENPLFLQKSMNSHEMIRNKNIVVNMEKRKKLENQNFIKREAEKNFLNDEKYDQQRFEYFFRFRISSLIKVLGFEKYYKNDSIVKGGKKNVIFHH